jgi:putative transposase
MSRRGHCLDNAVAESFFHSLKTERVKRKVYENLNEAQADLFDYIEMFYNRKRLHSHLGHVSPDEYENQFLTGSYQSIKSGEDQLSRSLSYEMASSLDISFSD